MLRSLATCVSAEMFISFNCAMSMVEAPSGRSGATNFFELIGGFFLVSSSGYPLLVWDVIYGSSNSRQEFVLSRTRDCRKRNYLLRVKCFGACTERLIQLVARNFVDFGQN